MERVVPWSVLVQIVASYYPKAKTGRLPFGIECMLMLRSGTAVDATLISAPSSTKNAEGERARR